MQYIPQPFRLYALSNCPFCQNAVDFMTNSGMMSDLYIADNDPIITQGAIRVTGRNQFPILVSRLTNEIVTGWRENDYKRLLEVFNKFYRPSTSNLSVDGKPVVQENSGEGAALPQEVLPNPIMAPATS